MTTALLNDFLKVKIKTNDPEEKFLTSGVSWAAYESLIESLGNSSSYRVAYLRETLEIMSPSRSHELDKENLGRLLEAYLEENRIRFWGLGSTTFKSPDKQAGKEPDKCYCLESDKDIPDLAIEVSGETPRRRKTQGNAHQDTSGGVDTLEIYQRLGVKEVWFWQNSKLEVYCLQDGSYQHQPQSKLLPKLDLDLFSEHITISDPLEAITKWRKQIKVD